MKLLVALLTLTVTGLSAKAGVLVRSDPDAIYNPSGTNTSPKLKMEVGLYELGPLAEGCPLTHYMMLERDVNDSNRWLSIIFESKAVNSSSDPDDMAWFAEGRIIKDGTVLMLTPLSVDPQGNLRVTSEKTAVAPALEISLRTDGFRFPYLVQPRNGAWGGKVFGMAGSSKAHPTLKDFPTPGVYKALAKRNKDMTYASNRLSVYNSGVDMSYAVIALNSTRGKFSGLTESRLVNEEELAGDKYVKLATSITGWFGSEMMLVMTPTPEDGLFHLDTFALQTPGFFESFTKGRTKPKFPR